jgi:flagellar biosynthesis protein FliP
VSSRGYLFLYIHSCTFDLKRTYNQFWDSSESDENDVSSVVGEFVFRKTLRQAYRGSLSLYLGFMLISLCFTSFLSYLLSFGPTDAF